MSNRRRPRNIHVAELRIVDDVNATVDELMAAPCPDCNADLVVDRSVPDFVRLEVQHDATCPWLRRWTA